MGATSTSILPNFRRRTSSPEDRDPRVPLTFNTTAEKIAEGRGILERRLVADIALEDGLISLRRIARRLGVTSAGGISSLAARWRRKLPKDAELRELVEICHKRMRRRPPPFAFPRLNPPVTARRYHRLPSRTRR